MPHIRVLLFLACTSFTADLGDFVYRACLVDAGKDYDLVMRQADTREAATLCVWRTTCSAAELVILRDPSAKQSYFFSRSPQKCK